MFNFLSPIGQIAQTALSPQHTDQEFLASTIGCVVDITQPLFRQKEGNYIVEIKIIDQTFNQFSESSFLIKYLSVLLVSQNSDELKLTSKIGDLIYIHKFMFSVWNEIKLKAKFYATLETVFQVHSGELDEDQSWRVEKKMGKETSPYHTEQLGVRIAELKNWLRISFTDVFKPFIGVKIINNYCTLIEPFSIILKVRDIRKNEFEHYLFLTDSNKNSFYVDLKPLTPLLFTKDEWIYLRGVKQINIDKQIIFTEAGRVIQLPQIFVEQFQNQSNHKAIYRKTNRLGTQKKQQSSLTFITLFDQKTSTVKQLFELQDHYQSCNKKEDVILQNNYLVKGAVVNYTGKIKLYHKDYMMIVHDNYLDEIPSQEKKLTIEEKKLVYVYEGTLYIVDRSISYKRQCLKIVLFTNDLKSTFFDQKELQKLSNFIGFSSIGRKIQESLKNINSKLQKLMNLSTFENPAALVLQPIRSDKLIFRLINTKIA